MDVLRTETVLMRKEKDIAAKAISQRLHQSGKLQSKADTLGSKQCGADEDGHMPTQVRQPPSPCHSHLDCSSSADLAAVIRMITLLICQHAVIAMRMTANGSHAREGSADRQHYINELFGKPCRLTSSSRLLSGNRSCCMRRRRLGQPLLRRRGSWL